MSKDSENPKILIGGKEIKCTPSKMSFQTGCEEKVHEIPVSINLCLKKSSLKLFEKGQGIAIPIRNNEDLPDTDLFISFK